MDKINRSIVGLLFALIMGGLMSCRNQSESQTIALGKSKECFQLADIAEPIAFIDIEATDSCLLTNVARVVETDNGFIILDMSDNGHPICVFSDTGKYIGAIGRNGNGPGEYTMAEDIALSPNRDSLLVCANHSELYTYALNGVFGRKIKADDFVPLNRIVTNSEHIAMAATNVVEGINQFYLFTPDMQNKFSGIPNEGHFTVPFCNTLAIDKNFAYFFDWYSAKLYEVNASEPGISRSWELELPNDVASNNFSEIMTFFMKQQEVDFIYNWSVANDKLIAFYMLNGESNIIVYDLEKNEVIKQGKYQDVLPDLIPGRTEGTYISFITYDVYEFYKDSLSKIVELPPFDTDKTNVILMLWRLKLNNK